QDLLAIPSFSHAQERQKSHERRDLPGRVPIGYRAGPDFPVRMSVAIENQFVRGSDRVLPARLCSRELLQGSALQRIVRDAGDGLPNKWPLHRPRVEKSEAPVWLYASIGFSPSQTVGCSARASAPWSDGFCFYRESVRNA